MTAPLRSESRSFTVIRARPSSAVAAISTPRRMSRRWALRSVNSNGVTASSAPGASMPTATPPRTPAEPSSGTNDASAKAKARCSASRASITSTGPSAMLPSAAAICSIAGPRAAARSRSPIADCWRASLSSASTTTTSSPVHAAAERDDERLPALLVGRAVIGGLAGSEGLAAGQALCGGRGSGAGQVRHGGWGLGGHTRSCGVWTIRAASREPDLPAIALANVTPPARRVSGAPTLWSSATMSPSARERMRAGLRSTGEKRDRDLDRHVAQPFAQLPGRLVVDQGRVGGVDTGALRGQPRQQRRERQADRERARSRCRSPSRTRRRPSRRWRSRRRRTAGCTRSSRCVGLMATIGSKE